MNGYATDPVSTQHTLRIFSLIHGRGGASVQAGLDPRGRTQTNQEGAPAGTGTPLVTDLMQVGTSEGPSWVSLWMPHARGQPRWVG